jgi:Flp pilus assembly protein TadD
VSGGDTAARLAKAEFLIDLGRPQEARSAIAGILAAEPDHERAQRMLVRCLLQLNDPDCMAAAGRAVELAPDSEHAHRLASLAHGKAGLHPGAVLHAREAVRLAPEEWRTHHVLTSALVPTDPGEAFAAGLAGVRVGPNEPSMHLVLGLAAMRSGRTARAAEAFHQVLSLDPDNAMARNNLAVLDLRANRYGQAIGGFGSALAADPRLDLARRNIDAVVISMLLKLRYGALVGELVVFQFVGSRQPGHTRPAAGGLLLVWALAAGWGVSRIPRALRGYAVGIFRRRRRAAFLCAVLALAGVGLVLGPLLLVVSPSAGLFLGMVAAVLSAGELVWFSRGRTRLSRRFARRRGGSGVLP